MPTLQKNTWMWVSIATTKPIGGVTTGTTQTRQAKLAQMGMENGRADTTGTQVGCPAGAGRGGTGVTYVRAGGRYQEGTRSMYSVFPAKTLQQLTPSTHPKRRRRLALNSPASRNKGLWLLGSFRRRRRKNKKRCDVVGDGSVLKKAKHLLLQLPFLLDVRRPAGTMKFEIALF